MGWKRDWNEKGENNIMACLFFQTISLGSRKVSEWLCKNVENNFKSCRK